MESSSLLPASNQTIIVEEIAPTTTILSKAHILPRTRYIKVVTIAIAIIFVAIVVVVPTAVVLSRRAEEPLHDHVNAIIAAALNNSVGYNRLGYLCDTFGGRLSGSQNLINAINWIFGEMKADNLSNVALEPVMVPTWVRGPGSLRLTAPFARTLPMLAFGGSIGTNGTTISAPVVVVKNWAELDTKGNNGEVTGKIVVFNSPWAGSYGGSVEYRSSGAAKASKYGALAALVRSVTPVSLQSPHTGSMQSASIPGIAITIEDADLLERLQSRGANITVELSLETQHLNDSLSHNIIAEVVGREHPEQVIVIGGHIDSWDPAQGAQDDGGGVMIAWETIRLIKELGLIPRRTIRCVLWTNEENGGRGGSQYYADHVGDMANHIAAIESDSGVYAPTGMGWASKKPNGYHYMENLFQRFITHQLHVKMIMGGGGADISPMTSNGVPGLSTENAASRSDPWQYFWIHHTYADTFDKIDQGEMNQNLAMLAATAYLLAELEQPLPRD